MGTAAAELVAELSRWGIELVTDGDRLRYRPRSALTRALAERLRTHKSDLLAILGPHASRDGATTAPTWEDNIDPPDPCPDCSGLLSWRNPLGDRRCLACDPPRAAIRLLERFERIRRRLGIRSPAGAAEMLAELKQLTATCISDN